jgi:hypothetical protein
MLRLCARFVHQKLNIDFVVILCLAVVSLLNAMLKEPWD